MIINKLILPLLFMMWTVAVFSQSFSGRITDTQNQPLQGAIISEIGTSNYSSADENGYFSIQTTSSLPKLEISLIGYTTRQLTPESSEINIQLHPEPIIVEELFVTSSAQPYVFLAEDINQVQQAKSINDLFSDIQGFNLVKRSNYATEPVFRAFKHERLNVQYDGAAKIVHACPNRMDPITSHVIPEEIQKIELVKGPFSTRFGPSFGGIINLVTNRTDRMRSGFHGSIEGGYDTNGGNLTSSGTLSYSNAKTDFSVAGSYKDFGHYKDGNGLEVPSAFSTYDVSVKAGFNPTPKQRLQASYRNSVSKDIYHAGLPMDNAHDKGQMVGLDYSIRDLSPVLKQVLFKSYYSYVDHLMTNHLRPNFKVVDASTPVFAKSYGGKLEFQLSPNEKSMFFAGLDYESINRTGSRTRLVKLKDTIVLDPPKEFVDSIWSNSTVQNVGLFGEAKFFLSKKWTLKSGLRFDNNSGTIKEPAVSMTKYYDELDNSYFNISAFVASTHHLSEVVDFGWSVGRGVRSSSMIERYINHMAVGSDPHELLGNPELSPEANHQLELSFAAKPDQLEISGSVFYSLLKNYIMPVVDTTLTKKFSPTIPPYEVKRFTNVDNAYQYGFDLFAEYTIAQKWKIGGNFDFVQAENMDTKEPLPQIAPMSGNLWIGYQAKKLWAKANARIVGAQSRISESFKEVESKPFSTFDISIGGEPLDNLILGASVHNLLDEAYYEHLNFRYKNQISDYANFILEPGRNISFFAKYKF